VADRLVAGTWAVAAVMTRGDVTVHRAVPSTSRSRSTSSSARARRSTWLDDGFRVRCVDRPRAVDVVTLPYPGFPTDLQPQFIALNSIARGAAMVTENLFEARFRFVNEMVRLGADVRTDGHHAMVRGKESLSGAPVEAADIRAGAGLVLAGLVADGVTTVYEPHHVDRGYEGFIDDLVRLGADVSRVQVNQLA
jgi:UDP-N-acetylglucosamine 1-carboxyvinyltransferase